MGKSRGKRYICTSHDCGKVFSRPSRLKHHEMIHTGVRPYLCEEGDCLKSYTRAAHLKRHIESSHTETVKPSGSTDTHSESVKTSGSTDTHSESVKTSGSTDTHSESVKTSGSTNTPKVKCADCNQAYHCESSLKKHVQIAHSGQLNYKCGEEGCDEAFRKKKQLRAHQYQHKGVLPYQCHVAGCLKKYAQKGHLDRHVKVHKGYKCPAEGCEKTFPKFTLLRKHQSLSHMKVYTCSDCKRNFQRRAWLQSHRLTHSDTRDLIKCPKDGCTRSYLDIKNLKAHLKSYHEGKKFVCQNDDCNRGFVTKQKLQDHEKLHSSSAGLPKKMRKGHKKGGARRHNIVTKLTGVPEDTLASMNLNVAMEMDELSCRDHVTCNDSNISAIHSSEMINVIALNIDDSFNNNRNEKEFVDNTTESDDSEIKDTVLHVQTTRMQQLYGNPENPSTSTLF